MQTCGPQACGPEESRSTLRTVTYLTLAMLPALAALTAIARAQDHTAGANFEQLVTTAPPPSMIRDVPGMGSITIPLNCNSQTRDDDIYAAAVIRATAQGMLDPDNLQYRFLLAYHTAAGDSEQADRAGSEFCATAIRRVLILRYHVAPERLFHVGYGSSRPVNEQDKHAPENQRLEITNLGQMADSQ